MGHYGVYTAGGHAGDSKIAQTRQVLGQKLEACGVQLYVAGHDHDQQLVTDSNGLTQVIQGAASKTRPTKGVVADLPEPAEVREMWPPWGSWDPPTDWPGSQLGFAIADFTAQEVVLTYFGEQGRPLKLSDGRDVSFVRQVGPTTGESCLPPVTDEG